MSAAKALSKIAGEFYLICPTDEIFTEIKKLNPGSKARSEAGVSIPRAASVAAIGLSMFLRGGASDVLTSSPKYSHDPNIREFGAKIAP